VVRFESWISAFTFKVRTRTDHEVPEWGVEVQPKSFFNLGDRLCGWPLSLSGRFTRRKEIGVWVGPMAGPDECGKSNLPPGFDPPADQPVASRYND
jgi:hypothetical protein